MADEALFFGWGDIVPGREGKAVEVFDEAVQYYGQLQQDGRIESFEAWFLSPHGGDLAGFFLLRAEREQLDEIERSPDSTASDEGRDDRREDGDAERLYGRGTRPADGSVRGGVGRPGRLAAALRRLGRVRMPGPEAGRCRGRSWSSLMFSTR